MRTAVDRPDFEADFVGSVLCLTRIVACHFWISPETLGFRIRVTEEMVQEASTHSSRQMALRSRSESSGIPRGSLAGQHANRRESIMSLRDKPRYAIIVVAVVGIFAAAGPAAATDDRQETASAFSGPVSAPCHPALAACTKHSQRVATTTTTRSTVIAYDEEAPMLEPASAPCHPALKVCVGWTRSASVAK